MKVIFTAWGSVSGYTMKKDRSIKSVTFSSEHVSLNNRIAAKLCTHLRKQGIQANAYHPEAVRFSLGKNRTDGC